MCFQDFPGPGIFKKKNQGFSRRHGNPDKCRQTFQHPDSDKKTQLLTSQTWLSGKSYPDKII